MDGLVRIILKYTRGEDIYLAIKEMLTKRGIELKPQIEPLFVLSLFDLTVSC